MVWLNKLSLLLVGIFFISLVFAINNPNLPKLTSPQITTTNINNNTLNVNNSACWLGYCSTSALQSATGWITNGNVGWTNTYGFITGYTESDPIWNSQKNNYCYANGTNSSGVNCQSSSSSNPFNQVLNTTSNVTFNNITINANSPYQSTISGGTQQINNISYTLPSTSGYLGFNLKLQGSSTCRPDIQGISQINSTDYWATGFTFCSGVYAGKVYYSNKSGAGTWTTHNPTSDTNAYIGIYAYDNSHVWILGQNITGGNVIKFWNGATWTTQTVPTSDTLKAIAGSDATHVWAVGGAGTAHGTICKFTSSWSCQTANVDIFYALQVFNSTSVYAMGRQGVFSLTTDGSTWATQGHVTSDVDSLSCVNQTSCWVGSKSGYLYSTTNSGSTWTSYNENAFGALNYNGIATTDMNNVYAVANGGVVLHSINGLNFTSMLTGTTNNLFGIKLSDRYTGLMIGDNGAILQLSTNNLGILQSNPASSNSSSLSWALPQYWTRDIASSGSSQGYIHLTQPSDIITRSSGTNDFSDLNTGSENWDIDNSAFYGVQGYLGLPASMNYQDPNGLGYLLTQGLTDNSWLLSVDPINRCNVGNDGVTNAMCWADNQITVGSASSGAYDNQLVCYTNNGELGHTLVIGTCTAN